jgi:hypothetical protein
MKTLLSITAAISIPCCQTACSFSVSADGAKSFNLDGEKAAKVIESLNQK